MIYYKSVRDKYPKTVVVAISALIHTPNRSRQPAFNVNAGIIGSLLKTIAEYQDDDEDAPAALWGRPPSGKIVMTTLKELGTGHPGLLKRVSRFEFELDPTLFAADWPMPQDIFNENPNLRAYPLPVAAAPDQVTKAAAVVDEEFARAVSPPSVVPVLALVAGRSILGSQLPEGSFEELILGGIVCPQVDAANQIVYSILRPFELKLPSAHQSPSEHERVG